MEKIKRILFPSDFSDTAQNAFLHCLLLSKELGASVTLLHAIYPEYETLDLPVMAARATKEKVEAARLTLRSFRDYGFAELQKTHRVENLPKVHIDVEVGSAARVITHIARRDEADLIIIGARGAHTTLERTFGSVTTHVIEGAPCPVLVIPEEAAYRQVNVVAYATDLREMDPYHFWKSGRILEALHPVLHVVHINQGGNHKEEIDFSEMVEFFAGQSPALQVQFHDILSREVEPALEEFVDIHEVDLLVMYAPSHNWLERIFTQSKTKRMAWKSTVPLLLIKTS